MTNQCGKNSTSGLCNGCVECHSQEKKEECKGCRKFGKREGCYACTPSEEKKWTCPCGKPAPGFDLCSKECEEKYRTDTPPLQDWDMKIRQILSKHWNEWPTEVVENFYSLLSQVREQAYREGQKEALKNVGMLRQWLNEDRITDVNKMVTNEEIKHFLTN